jgi:hypothetical protein
VIAKVVEKIVFNQFYEYFSSNDLLSTNQSGFRPFHSTVTTLHTIYYMDIGKINIAVFIDLRKAFDTVDHAFLVNKLNLYWFFCKELDWVRSYLSNRSQKCFINGVLSSPRTMNCGVPQRSILGPRFFLIFINDLPSCLSHTIPSMYADDTSISSGSEKIEELESRSKF